MIRVLALAGLAVASLLACASAALATEETVRIGDRLEPSAVTVPVGGTVTWHNADGERHRVRSTTGPERFDSGNLAPSQAWSWTFSVPGEHPYVDARDDDAEAYWGTVTVTGAAGQATGGAGRATGPADGGGAISMRDRSFTPAAVTVPAGTTVTWTNDSDRDHTVTADDGTFDSGTMPPGARFTHTFDQEGAYGYFCALHGGMRGTVSVGDGEDASGDAAPGAPAATDAIPDATPAPAPAPTASAQAPGGDVEVQVHDFAFAPEALEVRPGTTVTWQQAGEVPHTVTAGDGSFDSGLLQGGEAFSHTFAEPGTYEYVCDLHPQMVAAVTVAGDASSGLSGEADASGGPERDPPPGQAGGASATGDEQPLQAASSLRAADTGLVAGLLLVAVLLPASVLVAGWRIERAVRRLSSPGAPPTARRPPART